MKKILFIALAFIATDAYSQDIIDTFAKESCECINKNVPDLKALKPGEMKSQFLSCFFKSYGEHSAELKNENKLQVGDEAAMEVFGEQVAMKMLNYCPDVLMKFGEDVTDDDTAATTEKSGAVEGEVTEIKSEQFVTVAVKDKNARVHQLLLLTYFDTASAFTENQVKKKDKVSVSYIEQELYDPKLKEFRYFKIITDLKKL